MQRLAGNLTDGAPKGRLPPVHTRLSDHQRQKWLHRLVSCAAGENARRTALSLTSYGQWRCRRWVIRVDFGTHGLTPDIPSWQHRSSQRAQIIRHVAELPDHHGIAEIARAGLPVRLNARGPFLTTQELITSQPCGADLHFDNN
jgi:hypothetical protein